MSAFPLLLGGKANSHSSQIVPGGGWAFDQVRAVVQQFCIDVARNAKQAPADAGEIERGFVEGVEFK
jgi:hypothetical protein